MAAATAIPAVQKEETPTTTTEQQQPPSDPPTDNSIASSTQQPSLATTVADLSRKDAEHLKPAATGAAADSTIVKDGDHKDEPVSDIQKKMRRAERFGMSVQLSEEEKRNTRAERFGTGPVMHGSDVPKNSEEQKRKARAERFGLGQSVPAEEDAKKKARLARFGEVQKTNSLEEDKKKARALRFSQPPSAEVNGKGNDIETKTVIAGKAGGGT